MIPTNLNDWNISAVEAVAASGVAENDLFDLKADLQRAEHQRKAVAAFANTRGGYLVFGVDDERHIVGVKNVELPRDFGSKLRTGIEPSVEYRVGAPLPVSSGRFVFVIEIPRSPRGPHAVLLNNYWMFLKRTAGGSNDPMTYEEIRLAFQDTEAKRSKLAVVASELGLIGEIAARILSNIPEAIPAKDFYRWAWLTRYPTNLLDAILGDAYSMLAHDTETWESLGNIRDMVRTSNTLSETLSRLPFTTIIGIEEQRQSFQIEIRQRAIELVKESKAARIAITKLLGPEV